MFLNTENSAKYSSKYNGNFCLAVGSTGVISVHYQLSLCFLACKHFYRQGFLRIKKIVLGLPLWKKVWEALI
jgi:hypothetical protein